MLFSIGGLRAVRYLFIAFFISFSLSAAAAADLLELWFEYDGRPIQLTQDPALECLQLPGKQPVACDLYRGDDGRYWIRRPANGHYLLRLSADENRSNPPHSSGDLFRQYRFDVEPGTTGPLLISLQKRMGLQQPLNTAGKVAGQGAGCEGRPDYSADILALFPTARVEFAWSSLGQDVRYHYKLWRVRCGDGMRLEQLFYHQSSSPRVSESIPPNRPGEYYQFELSGVSDNQTVGRLLLDDGGEGSVGEFRFVVHDPLIDRSWLYYLLAALALAFVVWVVIGALRSPPAQPAPKPDDIRPRRRLRPVIAVMMLLGLGAAGYLQQEQLMPWLEEQGTALEQLATEGWERLQPRESAAPEQQARTMPQTGPATRTETALWRGVIVSATTRPFVGEGRRAEIQLRAVGEGVEVAIRQGGAWRPVTARPFRRQPSGSGMTLFGHGRGEGYSELWSISVPETGKGVWRLSLDRMITRRAADGRIVSSERRRASGEAHAVAP